MREMPPCKTDGVPCPYRYQGCQDRCPDMKLWKLRRGVEHAERLRTNTLYMNEAKRKAYNKRYGAF